MGKIGLYGDLLNWKEICSCLSLHHYCCQENNCEGVLPMKNTKAWEIICVCNYLSNFYLQSQWHQLVGDGISLYSYRKFPKRKAKLEKMSVVFSVPQNGTVLLLPWCSHLKLEGIYYIRKCTMFTFVVDNMAYNRASSQNWLLLSEFWLWKHDFEMRYQTASFAVWSRNNKVVLLLKLSQVLKFSVQSPWGFLYCAKW